MLVNIHSSITGLWDYIIFKKFNLTRESLAFLLNKMHYTHLSTIVEIFFIFFKKWTDAILHNVSIWKPCCSLVCRLTNSSMSRFKYHAPCLSLERARFIVAKIARYAISNLNHFRRFHGKRGEEEKRTKE